MHVRIETRPRVRAHHIAVLRDMDTRHVPGFDTQPMWLAIHELPTKHLSIYPRV